MGAGGEGSVASKDESPCDSPPPSRFAIHLPRFAGEDEACAAKGLGFARLRAGFQAGEGGGDIPFRDGGELFVGA